MTVEIFMTLITISAVITSLVTEAVKRVYKPKSVNVLALVVSVLIGLFVCVTAYIYLKVPFILLNCLYMIAFVMFNWLVATLGYDKVIQAFRQIVR